MLLPDAAGGHSWEEPQDGRSGKEHSGRKALPQPARGHGEAASCFEAKQGHFCRKSGPPGWTARGRLPPVCLGAELVCLGSEPRKKAEGARPCHWRPSEAVLLRVVMVDIPRSDSATPRGVRQEGRPCACRTEAGWGQGLSCARRQPEPPHPGPSCYSRGDLSLPEAGSGSLRCSRGVVGRSVQGRTRPRNGLKEPKEAVGAWSGGSTADRCNPGRLCGGGDTQARSRSADWRKVQEEGVWGSGCNFFCTILDFYKFQLLHLLAFKMAQ